jgi:hypothetical protein
MSRITNQSIKPGDAIDLTAANQKFTDIETATANLDAANFRAEAVDVGNISDDNLANTVVIKGATFAEDLTGATVTTTGGIVTLLDTAISPVIAVQTTDIIRFYMQVEITGFGTIPTNASVDAAAATAEKDATGGIFWLVWIEVDTDGAGTWTRLPNQTADPGAGADFRMDQSPTVMPILHYEYTDASNIGVAPSPIPIPPTVLSTECRASYSRGVFTVPGSPLTYHRARLRMEGLYRTIEAGGESYYTDAAYTGTRVQNITVGEVTLGHIVMRKS